MRRGICTGAPWRRPVREKWPRLVTKLTRESGKYAARRVRHDRLRRRDNGRGVNAEMMNVAARGESMPQQLPIKQCAVLAYRQNKNGLQIVLVTSLETRRWVLPKGHQEPGKSARFSASLEAYEEAGVVGAVSRERIGTYDYLKTAEKGGGLRRVSVFPMAVKRVKDSWPEMAKRRRKWMSPADAIKAVDEKKLKKLIAQFAQNFDQYRVAKT